MPPRSSLGSWPLKLALEYAVAPLLSSPLLSSPLRTLQHLAHAWHRQCASKPTRAFGNAAQEHTEVGNAAQVQVHVQVHVMPSQLRSPLWTFGLDFRPTAAPGMHPTHHTARSEHITTRSRGAPAEAALQVIVNQQRRPPTTTTTRPCAPSRSRHPAAPARLPPFSPRPRPRPCSMLQRARPEAHSTCTPTPTRPLPRWWPRRQQPAPYRPRAAPRTHLRRLGTPRRPPGIPLPRPLAPKQPAPHRRRRHP